MKNLDYYLSLNYRKTLYQDDDGDWIVEINDLPGCAADGRTTAEALENLGAAMRSWMASRLAAGLDVPEPREATSYSGKILLRMPTSLHRRLASQAQDEGVSLNQYVVMLLADGSSLRNCAVAGSAASLASHKLEALGIGVARILGQGGGNIGLSSMQDLWDLNAENARGWHLINEWRGGVGLGAPNVFLSSSCSLVTTQRAPWLANFEDPVDLRGIRNSAPGDQPNLNNLSGTGVRKGIA